MVGGFWERRKKERTEAQKDKGGGKGHTQLVLAVIKTRIAGMVSCPREGRDEKAKRERHKGEEQRRKGDHPLH